MASEKKRTRWYSRRGSIRNGRTAGRRAEFSEGSDGGDALGKKWRGKIGGGPKYEEGASS